MLGQPVPGEVPTPIAVTGDQLNLPQVATGVLTATVHQVQDTVDTPTEVSAEAYFEVTIDARFFDEDGNEIYDGPMIHMRFGHVKVTCQPAVDPSPRTTSPSETPVTTPASITMPPTTPATSSNPSTEPPSGDTASPSQTTGAPVTGPPPPGGAGTLPVTGTSALPWGVAGLAAIGLGIGLLIADRRRSTQ